MGERLVVNRRVEITLHLDPKRTPVLPVNEPRSMSRAFQPNQVHIIAYEATDGTWASAHHAGVSGPYIKKNGEMAAYWYRAQFGLGHRPFPHWLWKRLIQSDVPTEIRQVVLRMAHEEAEE